MSAKHFPEEHRATYNAAYTKGVDQGIGLAETRIIKILKQQGIIADVDAVIALIKGEK